MTSVAELNPGSTNGVVRVKVLVIVILIVVGVAFRKVQYPPPSDVAVVAGSVIALKPEFRR